MSNLLIPHYALLILANLLSISEKNSPEGKLSEPTFIIDSHVNPSIGLDCNCNITQDGSTYAISALLGTESASSFYSYGTPLFNSANTGLEIADALILFLYQDLTTGIVSLFLIADIGNSGSGGSMEFEANCLPSTAYVSVQDDAGEFFGTPPLITGSWSWLDCCTDGGVIEDIGCNNTINLDLLVSSGLNEIIWLTGDIANPTQINLGLTGEAITINCGGGVCCPVGLDTGASVTNSTCTDSDNGSISVFPEDGVGPYTYNWSNGESGATITGLAPGWYWVTVTDSQGCTEDLAMIIDVSPGDPAAQPAELELCSENAEAFFDLTMVEDVINLNSGFDVLWFENQDLTGQIADPSNYLSPSATIYAVVDNGSCLSDPVPIELTVIPSPVAESASMNRCEESNEMATFNLTLLDQTVSGGIGIVFWYLDPNLNNLIPEPGGFLTVSTTVYATVDDGICISAPVEVELIVDLQPIGFSTSMELCGDQNDEAVFDLTLLDLVVSDGIGSVSWYLDQSLFELIPVPSAFITTTTIVYAAVSDGICFSDPVPVDIIVNPTPIGNPVSAFACDDGSGEAEFNLWNYASQVSGGAGGVEWFLDEFLLEPVPDPIAFITGSTTIYAVVDNGVCISDPVPVQLNVLQSPIGNSTSLVLCSDSTGQGIFNLTLADIEVSGGVGVVQWFDDAQGVSLIMTPAIYPSMGGVVYAQIVLGTCLSELVPITLVIVNSVEANPAQVQACDEGNGIAEFDLTIIETQISGGTGQVGWYLDSIGTLAILSPDSFPSGNTNVYANVSAGTCVSEFVSVDLLVSPVPLANPLTLGYCLPFGDTLLVDLTLYDTAISGGLVEVQWFLDSFGNNAVQNTGSFTSDTSTTLYVNVTNGFCTSMIVPIEFLIQTLPLATPFSVSRCGDANGMVTIDLSTVESAVSNNIGTVFWFADPSYTIPLDNTDSLVTGDTVVYAQVINGSCFSQVVPITISIVDSLLATPFTIEECIIDADSAVIDLTQYDLSISNGGGPVYWYSDSLQSNSIVAPEAFVTTGDTLYANVIADGCISNLVSIPVTLESIETPMLTCSYTSIDSVVISWPSVASAYELAFLINDDIIVDLFPVQDTFYSVGGLAQGDTLYFVLLALFNGICTSPLQGLVTCITDVCPPQHLQFTGLDSEYCRDEPFVLIQPDPPGGILIGQGLVGDTLFPSMVVGTSVTLWYVWEDQNSGCQYDLNAVVNINDAPEEPIVECGPLSMSEVSFEWSGNRSGYGYQYQINQGTLSQTVFTSDSVLVIQNLTEGDAVTLYLWATGQGACKNSDTIIVTCITRECPAVTIRIEGPDSFCPDDDPVQLNLYTLGLANIDKIHWTGTGITDSSGIFDPALALEGQNDLAVTVESDGCVYVVPINVIVLPEPVASFTLSGVPCLDSILNIEFNGFAFLSSSSFYWELGGGVVTQDNRPTDFSIHWDSPGNYILSLYIESLGCISDTFIIPVQVNAPMEKPVITCIEEDYYSIVVEWEPVPGASQYLVSSSTGTGSISGTTYTIRNMMDDTPVIISVTAIGQTACGPASAEIECRTNDYIPPQIYIPNVFSPNGDGINDVFFIQTNDRITRVITLAIFDRWGNIVFKNNNFLPNEQQHGWDGYFNEKVMNDAVFTYVAELEDIDGHTLLKAGDVTLLR